MAGVVAEPLKGSSLRLTLLIFWQGARCAFDS